MLHLRHLLQKTRNLPDRHVMCGQAKLQPMSLGSSADLLVGQRVYAIGNPFGTAGPSPLVSRSRCQCAMAPPTVLGDDEHRCTLLMWGM